MRSPIKYVLLSGMLLFTSVAQAKGPDVDQDGQLQATDDQDRIGRMAARFKGSIFLFDQSVTPDTIDAQAQQSPVPSYQWWLSLRPRFYFTPKLSIRVRMDLTVEWLQGGAETTYLREPQFGDLWVDLAYNPRTFAGIVPTIALRTIWGTSKVSIGDGVVAKIGPSISAVREFQTRKAGAFEISLGMYGLYHFDTSTSGGTATTYGCATTDLTPESCSQNTGLMNTQGSLTSLLSGKYSPIPQLSINVTYAVLDSWAYKLPNASLPNNAQMQNAYDTRFRQSGWFLASIDYDPKDWLEFSLGYYCLRPIRDPDSKIGDPFWSPGGNTRIFFTTTFNLDKVGEAAARRAKRARAEADQKKHDLAFRF